MATVQHVALPGDDARNELRQPWRISLGDAAIPDNVAS